MYLDGVRVLDLTRYLPGPLPSFSQALAPDALGGATPRPGETALTGELPWYDIYETADGGYVTIAALEPTSGRRSVRLSGAGPRGRPHDRG